MAAGMVGIYLMMGAWIGYRFTCMSSHQRNKVADESARIERFQ